MANKTKEIMSKKEKAREKKKKVEKAKRCRKKCQPLYRLYQFQSNLNFRGPATIIFLTPDYIGDEKPYRLQYKVKEIDEN